MPDPEEPDQGGETESAEGAIDFDQLVTELYVGTDWSGASATMTFMGQLFNKQSSYRKIGDILMIGEPDGSWPIPKEGE